MFNADKDSSPTIVNYLHAQLLGFVSKEARWIKELMQTNEQMYLADNQEQVEMLKVVGSALWRDKPASVQLDKTGKPSPKPCIRVKDAAKVDTTWNKEGVLAFIRADMAKTGLADGGSKMAEFFESAYFKSQAPGESKSKAAFWKGRFWIQEDEDYLLPLHPTLAIAMEKEAKRLLPDLNAGR
jgi:hypothetical protein